MSCIAFSAGGSALMWWLIWRLAAISAVYRALSEIHKFLSRLNIRPAADLAYSANIRITFDGGR
jgi:hypothetical protein